MKLSKLASISLSVCASVIYLFGVASAVGAQDGGETADTGQDEVQEMASEEVPPVGTLGDVLARWQERLQLFLARTDEQKLELEEKFAARRRAQMEKLEELSDDDPKKQRLIEALEERHEKLLERIEQRAERIGDRTDRVEERLNSLRDRLEARKDRVLQRRTDRAGKVDDLRLRLQEKRQERLDAVRGKGQLRQDGVRQNNEAGDDDNDDRAE